MTIYLVEDDGNIRSLVLYALNASGFEAEGFEEAAPFYEAVKRRRPDLVLLDIMLPGGEDGLSILRRLRSNPQTQKLPVTLLTARDSEYDKVLGLDGGADDYITKPFGMMELISRVKALMRRISPEKEQMAELYMGDVAVCPRKREVMVKGEPIALTMKEFDLLQLLFEAPDIVHSRDTLMEKVWGYNYEGETRTVDVHIRSLRQKLGDAAKVIETVRGVGYKAVNFK